MQLGAPSEIRALNRTSLCWSRLEPGSRARQSHVQHWVKQRCLTKTFHRTRSAPQRSHHNYNWFRPEFEYKIVDLSNLKPKKKPVNSTKRVLCTAEINDLTHPHFSPTSTKKNPSIWSGLIPLDVSQADHVFPASLIWSEMWLVVGKIAIIIIIRVYFGKYHSYKRRKLHLSN